MRGTIDRVVRAMLCSFAGAILLMASGCGGGGGGSAAPAATLRVSASASTVAAGAQPVSLTATATNSSGTVSWSVSGPGSLSATTGSQVSYVPPLPSQLGNATGATVTATLGSLQRSVQIALTPAPGSNWQVAQPPDSYWDGVRYVNGRFYAMDGEAVLSSLDGVQWAPVSLPADTVVLDLTLGPQGLVAVGGHRSVFGGAALYSQDGVTWSTGTIVAATDGTGWDPTLLQLNLVAFGNGVYVGTGIEGIITSTDGINWVSRTGPVAGAGVDIYQLAFGNGRFVAMGFGGSWYSTDGVQWTPINLPTGFTVSDGVVFGNGIFVAGNNSVTITSTDGINWTNGGSVADTTTTSYGVRSVLAFGNGRFYAYGQGVDVSTDGVHWSQIYSVASGGLPITGVAADATDTVLVGWQGVFEHSSDGVHWASPPLGASPGVDSNLNGVDCMNGTCVALASNGSVLTSTDALHWNTVPLAASPVFNAITHGNGLFVAAGSATAGAVIYTSPDGMQWTPTSINATTNFFAAAYGNGRYVVAGASDSVFTSTDGVNWSTQASGMGSTGTNNRAVTHMAFGNGRFVAVANVDTLGLGTLYSSTDGIHWTAGPPSAPAYGLTYGDRAGFVAVGALSSVWLSVDGITWTTASTGSALYAVTYGDSQYVAAGLGGVVMLSEDAVHWSAQTLEVWPTFSGAAFSGQAFVLVGDSGSIVVSTQ